MAFESWGIVELMGHARIAGRITETTMLGTSLLRVDVPKTSQREPFTKYYSAGAIYCITPTDMLTATMAAEKFNEAAVQPWILPAPQNPALAVKVFDNRDKDDEWFGDDEDEDRPRDGLFNDLKEVEGF